MRFAQSDELRAGCVDLPAFSRRAVGIEWQVSTLRRATCSARDFDHAVNLHGSRFAKVADLLRSTGRVIALFPTYI